MKFIIFSIISLAILEANNVVSYEIETFEEFKKVFNKSYSTTEEESIRKENFLKSLKYVKGNNGVRINQFSDLSIEEFKAKYTNFVKSFVKTEKYDYGSCKIDTIPPPLWLDLRLNGTLTPIRMQGHCGANWAFSTIASVESAYIARRRTNVDLSEQELVDCASNHGCRGEDVINAFDYIKKYGVVTESVYPYNARENHCRRYNTTRYPITDFCKIYPSEEDKIKQLLDQTKSAITVLLAIRDIEYFRHYNGSIIRSDEGYNITYVNVNIVGYGRARGIDYWIIRNSWDTTWGDYGYGYIEQHKNLMRIQDNAFAATLKSA